MLRDLIVLVAALLLWAFWVVVAILVAAWFLICLALWPITWFVRRSYRRRRIVHDIKASIETERIARAWAWYAKAPAPPMPEGEE